MEAGRPYGGISGPEREAERRRRLMAAGLELFGRGSFAGTSVQALCDEASVTRRAFYESFSDREALLRAVHDEVVGELVRVVLDALPSGADAADALEVAVRRAFAHLAEDKRRARLQFVAVVGVSVELEEHRRATTRAISEQLAAVLEPALPALAELGRRRVALGLLGAMDELIMDWLWRPDGALEDLADEAVVFVRARVGN